VGRVRGERQAATSVLSAADHVDRRKALCMMHCVSTLNCRCPSGRNPQFLAQAARPSFLLIHCKAPVGEHTASTFIAMMLTRPCSSDDSFASYKHFRTCALTSLSLSLLSWHILFPLLLLPLLHLQLPHIRKEINLLT
jgi:hypothetical protein